MEQKIRSYLSNSGYFAVSSPSYRRAFLVNIILPLMMFLAIFFAFINYMHLNNFIAGHITLASFIFSSVSMLYFKKSNDLHIATYCTLTVACLTVALLSYFLDYQNNVLIWASAVPLLAFALVMRKKGVIISIIFYLIFCISYLFHSYSTSFAYYKFEAFLNFLFASVGLILLSYYYEYSRERAFANLEENQAELKMLAETDKLTGLYNRSKIDEIVSDILQKAKENDCEFSLIMADLDDFKEINDKYGHLIGDRVIEEISSVIRKSCQDNCYASRWGGEEFLIVLDNCGSDNAYEFAENLRSAIKSQQLSVNEDLTFTLGVTEYEKGDTAMSIFRRVDDALYKGKGLGKDITQMA